MEIVPVEAIYETLGLHSLHGYMAPWLGDHSQVCESLCQMLKALKTASESYLEASILTAKITIPFRTTNPFFHTPPHRQILYRSGCSLTLHHLHVS